MRSIRDVPFLHLSERIREYLHVSNGIPIRVRCCVVWNQLSDSPCILHECENRMLQSRLLDEGVGYVSSDLGESWNTDVVEVQAPDAVVTPLDAGRLIDTKAG